MASKGKLVNQGEKTMIQATMESKEEPNMFHSPVSLDFVVQDEKGNRIQCSVTKKNMHKFKGMLEEGQCYQISNFGIGENGGHDPLLNHNYKIIFYKNTVLTRIKSFDWNIMGFKFVCISKIKSREIPQSDCVDVIGSVVSIGDSGILWYRKSATDYNN
ncbi:hypothetical protein CTI12_AA324490 [Artemisia annua]|uniref:Replication protein A 70 kDa DNA-binding subunit B/D first OB fold domain-containing protein n=1 Tax=Artemisia annua TaxID=35608 RepID=A0A2U1MZV5_ARTAN|nr:hypothetical protein CTI12_AA324490 [Artemisia annua]